MSPTGPVAVVRCADYRPEAVEEAVRRSLELLGGLREHIPPGSRVVVKPNLLQGAPPERCVTPHPEVVRAVATLLREHGCEVVIAESAGGGTMYTEGELRRLYRATGMDGAAERAGVRLNFDTSSRDVPTLRRARERGLLPDDYGVPTVGDDPGPLVVPDFCHPSVVMVGVSRRLAGPLMRLMRVYALRPVVIEERCIGCGLCAKSCPRGTIRMAGGKARVKHRHCIRCFCCHEMCPRQAIGLQRSLAGRALVRLTEHRPPP